MGVLPSVLRQYLILFSCDATAFARKKDGLNGRELAASLFTLLIGVVLLPAYDWRMCREGTCATVSLLTFFKKITIYLRSRHAGICRCEHDDDLLKTKPDYPTLQPGTLRTNAAKFCTIYSQRMLIVRQTDYYTHCVSSNTGKEAKKLLIVAICIIWKLSQTRHDF